LQQRAKVQALQKNLPPINKPGPTHVKTAFEEQIPSAPKKKKKSSTNAEEIRSFDDDSSHIVDIKSSTLPPMDEAKPKIKEYIEPVQSHLPEPSTEEVESLFSPRDSHPDIHTPRKSEKLTDSQSARKLPPLKSKPSVTVNTEQNV
jgi:hypothetical protein